MDRKGEYAKCPQQQELEKIQTINPRGYPRLVAIEQPVTSYYRDEGGESKVLFFGFEVHGDLSSLKPLADKQDRVPLRAELVYENGDLVPKKDENGADIWKPMGNMEEFGPDKKPFLSLTTRTGGVRYHITKVSMRNESRKYAMRVSIDCPTARNPILPRSLLSIGSYVYSKRTGKAKLEKNTDAQNRINRLRQRKEKLRSELQESNQTSMAHVQRTVSSTGSQGIAFPVRGSQLRPKATNYRSLTPTSVPLGRHFGGNAPPPKTRKVAFGELGYFESTNAFVGAKENAQNRCRSGSDSSCTTDASVSVTGCKRDRNGIPQPQGGDYQTIDLESTEPASSWIVRRFENMEKYIQKLEATVAELGTQVNVLKQFNSSAEFVLDDTKSLPALKRGVSVTSNIDFDLVEYGQFDTGTNTTY